MSEKKKLFGRLPGDLSKEELIARIIRVDQAGEYGAKRIYEGQLSVLGGTKDETVLREMADTEVVHLDTFNKLMVERRVRPTVLAPFWHFAGFALGFLLVFVSFTSKLSTTNPPNGICSKFFCRT